MKQFKILRIVAYKHKLNKILEIKLKKIIIIKKIMVPD